MSWYGQRARPAAPPAENWRGQPDQWDAPTPAERLATVYAELVAIEADAHLAPRGSSLKRAYNLIRSSRRELLKALGEAGVSPP